ncbi:MAG: hypothetical protein FWH26_00515 [Oscillospiraceae bacterium]|nr:hypothetical protein [Oscillospiraceae bacterium]
MEKTYSAAELIPDAYDRVFEAVAELRLLRLLEESDKEIEAGVFYTQEEIFEEMEKMIDGFELEMGLLKDAV